MKNDPVYEKWPSKRAALSIGALFGSLGGGFVYLNFRQKKKKHIWVPFINPNEIKN